MWQERARRTSGRATPWIRVKRGRSAKIRAKRGAVSAELPARRARFNRDSREARSGFRRDARKAGSFQQGFARSAAGRRPYQTASPARCPHHPLHRGAVPTPRSGAHRGPARRDGEPRHPISGPLQKLGRRRYCADHRPPASMRCPTRKGEREGETSFPPRSGAPAAPAPRLPHLGAVLRMHLKFHLSDAPRPARGRLLGMLNP